MEGQGDHFENICQKVMTGKRSQKISLLVFKGNHNETQLLHNLLTYLYFALFMGEVFFILFKQSALCCFHLEGCQQI